MFLNYIFLSLVSDGKLYDAYVLYPKNSANCAYSSDIFVLKALPEVLEKQCGYKLFICGRDDLPGQGMYIKEVCLRLIEHCSETNSVVNYLKL